MSRFDGDIGFDLVRNINCWDLEVLLLIRFGSRGKAFPYSTTGSELQCLSLLPYVEVVLEGECMTFSLIQRIWVLRYWAPPEASSISLLTERGLDHAWNFRIHRRWNSISQG